MSDGGMVRDVARVEAACFCPGGIGNALMEYARACVVTSRRFSVAEFLNGVDTKLDNNDQAILGRLLTERMPQVVGLLRLRASKYDGIFAQRPRYRAAMGYTDAQERDYEQR